MKSTLLNLFTSNVSFEIRGKNCGSHEKAFVKGTVLKRNTTTMVNEWSPPYVYVDKIVADDWKFVKSLLVPSFLREIKNLTEEEKNPSDEIETDSAGPSL